MVTNAHSLPHREKSVSMIDGDTVMVHTMQLCVSKFMFRMLALVSLICEVTVMHIYKVYACGFLVLIVLEGDVVA